MTPTSDADSILEYVMQEYANAALQKDVHAFLALYAEDVRIFDLWAQWSYNSRREWRIAVESWFASLGEERVRVSFSDLQATASESVCTAHAFVSYSGLSPVGDDLRTMHNRLTWVLEQRDARWLIVHEHTSAPIDADSMKVMLAR